MNPPTPPPISQPTRYTCPNCGAGWNEPLSYCPHCGAPQIGAGTAPKSGMPVWAKILLTVFGLMGLLVFCALGACFYLLARG